MALSVAASNLSSDTQLFDHEMTDLKLYDNIFIETNLLSPNYDGVVLVLHPEDNKVELPQHIRSFINQVLRLDKHVKQVPTVWNCDYVSGQRLILAPTGKITPYHDARVLYQAAKKGVQRAIEAGVTKPLIVVQNVVDFPDGQLVCILGALEAYYSPIQMRERTPEKCKKFYRLGLHAEGIKTESFERTVRNAIALERSRIIARDIAGGDPERMTPAKIVAYLKEKFDGDKNITINVIEDQDVIAKEYPLLHAVSRAANTVDRHKARVVEILYQPSDVSRVSETLMLVGKGVTYDTGGADIKINGKMSGMSRDKSGAAAVAGFLKSCSILKPPHLKALGVLCLCRNSVGSESYVSDELLQSRSGKSVRVTNTDAEGRLAMADALTRLAEQAENELNPHLYTIATLTGHARLCYGPYTAAMDNHSARNTGHSNRLQLCSCRLAEALEVSSIRPEDLEANMGKCEGDDLVQVDMKRTERHHQLAGGFLMKVAGLDERNVKYTHLDIAGAAGSPPDEPTAVPILTLCHAHKVLV